MPETFTQKILSYSFDKQASGSSTSTGTLKFEGLRSSFSCQIAAGSSGTNCEIEIWGMTLSHMNELTTLAPNVNFANNNQISVSAGDSNGTSLVFKGPIVMAYCDATNSPSIVFRISSNGGNWINNMPSEVTSTKGSGDVATIAKQLAGKMGLAFVDKGVNVKLSNPYFWSNYGRQLDTLCEHANIECCVDRGTLTIAPRPDAPGTGTGATVPGVATGITTTSGTTPSSGSGILIAPETGMVGAPAFTTSGIVVRTMFNPALKWGDQITVKSQLQPACGQWTIQSLYCDLQCRMPGGRWFSTINAWKAGASK